MTEKRPTAEARADRTTAAARAIIDAERRSRDAKTERLRNARLESQAAELSAPIAAKSGAQAPKKKGKKR